MGRRGPATRRSPRRRVTPLASSQATRGRAYFRVVPRASRMADTGTPSGEAASSAATMRAAWSKAAAENHRSWDSTTRPRRSRARNSARSIPSGSGGLNGDSVSRTRNGWSSELARPGRRRAAPNVSVAHRQVVQGTQGGPLPCRPAGTAPGPADRPPRPGSERPGRWPPERPARPPSGPRWGAAAPPSTGPTGQPRPSPARRPPGPPSGPGAARDAGSTGATSRTSPPPTVSARPASRRM